jgi:hypothetical protein
MDPLFLKSIRNLGMIFIAALLFSACDGSNGDSCVSIEDDPDFLFGFETCPTDGLQMVCNKYDCVLSIPIGDPPPPEQLVRINPRSCLVIDCFTMECETRNPFGGEFVGDLTYSIEDISAGSVFSGVTLEGGIEGFTYACSPKLD